MVKIFLSVFMVISCLVMFSSGCSKEKPSEPGVVDYMSGAEQLRTYQKAKVKIEDIDNKLKENYQQVD